ncbi:MAG: T9SS type A sorting domain-containing protein, partial [Bacteroidota bacterium]
YNGNGVMDLIIGDVAFSNLNLLINGGSSVNTNSDMISSDPLFPINSVAVNLEIFPAAFYVDVDFDGIKDLIVGTNARNVSSNELSVLFYKNTGSNDQPNFVYQTNAFLQEQMIEHGTATTPVITDIDNDGLQDLFISNFFRHKAGMLKESTIAFYKNTGTATEPELTFIDNDFLNLSQTSYGLKITPTFGDLTGDGLNDLILGLENGTLVFYRNNSSPPAIGFAPPVLGMTDNSGTVISVGQYAAPQLFDLNEDGLLDLIIGRKTGELVYYKNIGTNSTPSFSLYNSTLGNVDLATDSPDGYAYPHFFMHNDTIRLFVGASDGKLRYYKNIEENLDPGQSFEMVSNSYLGINTGAYSSFAVTDIDGDGRLNLFAGQDLGGLHHFEADPNSTLTINEMDDELFMAVFPNPTEGSFKIVVHDKGSYDFMLADAFGNCLVTGRAASSETEIDLNHVAKGVYFLRIVGNEGSVALRKVIKN